MSAWTTAEMQASEKAREERRRHDPHGDLAGDFAPPEWVPPNVRARGCTCGMCWYRYRLDQVCVGVLRESFPRRHRGHEVHGNFCATCQVSRRWRE